MLLTGLVHFKKRLNICCLKDRIKAIDIVIIIDRHP